MTIRGIMAVMVLGAASMCAQTAAPAAPDANAQTAAPDANKPADHPACMHAKGRKDGMLQERQRRQDEQRDGLLQEGQVRPREKREREEELDHYREG